MKLLLISNSTNVGEEYLKYPIGEIGRFLEGVDEVVFVPPHNPHNNPSGPIRT